MISINYAAVAPVVARAASAAAPRTWRRRAVAFSSVAGRLVGTPTR
ncbi:hypothetical protein [Rhodococcus sp. 105337]|nr:hypothetical protein [Rhodococcus sp. 105337]NME78459.1 hypothetical protein [Rhodococcus sp. 105337]